MVPSPIEIVDLYPERVPMKSLISPFMNSNFAQSRKPADDFPAKSFMASSKA
jgi:hypothetical protein